MADIKILLVGDIGTGKDSYVKILIGKSYVILRGEKRSERMFKTFDLEKHEDINLDPDFMTEYCNANQFSHWFRTSSTDDLNIYESIWYLCNKIIQIRRSLMITHLSSPTLNKQKRKRLIKFVVIGACGTGKTSIIRRYVDNSFEESYRATLGIDCLAKTTREKDIPIDLHIWVDADAFLIVFDVNKPSTLENDALKWKLDVDRKVKCVEDKRIPCFLIGNKYDPSKREIVTDGDSMKKFCRSHEFSQYLNVSARAKSNIDHAFSRILTVAIACHNIEQEVGREQSQQHE
ncbi:unnamed protein product [Adineta ricciae]|uniref:Uncharacterized protein n=1 Tax=Adineta ricciae TaxID=249248 RepID=A0A814TAI8_ADIRI|nr:unnamed protein product [Adineta ricciae]